jgi:Protein of unknown function (DUF1064)
LRKNTAGLMQAISREEARKLLQKAKPSKYRAKPTEVDGIRFASGREAARWMVLKTLERTGEISDLRRQVSFPLHVAGVKICTYYADFLYKNQEGICVVEDAKAKPTSTAVYRLKKKMLAAEYGIQIVEV